ncbi:MAG: hypothetical protein ABI644_10030 [Arenimonas sp.]
MIVSPRVTRSLVWLTLAMVLVSATTGCSWLKKRVGYGNSKQTAPLEIPPGLDAPSTANALIVPNVEGTTVRGEAAVETFTVNDSLESTWRRMGLALNRIEGVTVTGSAQALGSYDVRYQGLNYLIRAENAGETTRITAFTSEGAAAANSPAGRLLGILKSRLN